MIYFAKGTHKIGSMQTIRYLLFICFIFFASCKQEVFQQLPVLSFIWPPENHVYTADSCCLVIKIDNPGLNSSLSVNLLNNNKVAILNPQHFELKDGDSLLNICLKQPPTIESNNYYLYARLSNKQLERHFYHEIRIAPQPIDHHKLLILQSDSSSSALWKLDLRSGQWLQIVGIPASAVAYHYTSFHDVVAIAGAYPSLLRAFRASDGQQLWSASAFAPHFQYTQLFGSNNLLYAADAIGRIRKLNIFSGQTLGISPWQTDTITFAMLRASQYLLALQRKNAHNLLSVFIEPGLTLHGKLPFFNNIVAIASETDGAVRLLEKTKGGIQLHRIIIQNMIMQPLFVSENTEADRMIALPDGGLLLGNSRQLFKLDKNYQELRLIYQQVTRLEWLFDGAAYVYLINGLKIKKLDLNGTMIAEYTMPQHLTLGTSIVGLTY